VPPVVILKPASALTAAQVGAFRTGVLGMPALTVSSGVYRGFGQAALAGNELVGLVTGSLITDNDRSEERLLYLEGGVHPGWRRCGIGRSLTEALAAACRESGRRVTAFANLSAADAASAGAFLTKMGFAETAGAAVYERDLRSQAPPPPSAEAYSTRDYRGGDAVLDAVIVDLYRRAYRGRAGVPELTVESLRRQFTQPDLVYLLAFDGDRRLVGHASALVSKDRIFVDSIQVARSHWGAGVSDSLARAITRLAFATGARRIVGAADTTNRANRALMERHGLQMVEIRRRFWRVLEAR
jgi:GNAT superfamily N-acetyltransferase